MYAGSFVALVTPFRPDYAIDWDAYGRLVDFHLDQGTNGLVPCGCTGEAATLTHEEQMDAIRFVHERVAGRVPVIAGTGSNNTAEAIRLTKHAAEIGCDGALVITPYYNKPTPAGQVAHYTRLADECGINIMLYNVPGRTGTKMSAATIATLGEHPRIVSVKEAANDLDLVSDLRAISDINIMSGDDSLTLPMLAVGASGVVSVTANIAPALMSGMCAAANAGDYEKARALHFQLLPLFRALFVETNPIPLKAAMARLGLCENVLRLPLTPALPESLPVVEAALDAAGLAAVA